MRAKVEKRKTIGKVKILVVVLDSEKAYQLSCSMDLELDKLTCLIME